MRLGKLDLFRGIAIILMVLFHLNYSLVNIFQIEILNFSDFFWFIVGKTAALLFILIAGISFYFASEKYKNGIYKKYIKMSLLLGFIAGGISFSTYYFFPSQYIAFGIIHFFAVSFLLLLLFQKFGYLNIFFGGAIIYIGSFLTFEMTNKYMYFLGYPYHGFRSADYYPLFPYFGYLLIGYVLGKYLGNSGKISILRIGKMNYFYVFLSFAGKKSLLIYILHQPIIISSIYIIQKYFII